MYTCIKMYYIVQARRAAIGGGGGVNFKLSRVLKFAEVWFEPVPEPRNEDWLTAYIINIRYIRYSLFG